MASARLIVKSGAAVGRLAGRRQIALGHDMDDHPPIEREVRTRELLQVSAVVVCLYARRSFAR
jgi:hypothetical protein